MTDKKTRSAAAERILTSGLMRARVELSAQPGVAVLLSRLGVARLDFGGAVNGFADALVSAAAADVAAHAVVDVGIGGIRFLSEQGSGRHDLAALAIAA